MNDSQALATPNSSPTEERSRGLILLAIMLALFLAALDQTIVGTALPKIVTDLGGSSLYVWAVTAYLVSSTITVPIYGKFGDVFGRKRMLLIGVVLFLVGSALSGQSQNMTELITFRSIQGLGAGALFPIALAVIGDLFTPRERGRYQGLFGAVFGVSFLIGPFLGGFLTDNVSWRWIFYVNIPIGLVSLGIITVALHNHRSINARLRDLDYAGIVTFTAGLIPALIGLSNKGNTDANGLPNSWSDPAVGGLIAVGTVLIIVFLFIENRAQHPILPLYLFKNRTIAAANAAVFLVSFGLFSAIIFIPRYYQVVQGISATKSGYMVWPMLVGLIGASIGTGILIAKTGKYKKIIVGAMVFFFIGGLLTTRLQTDTSNAALWFWLGLLGLGVGPSMSAFTVIIQNVAEPKDLGVATGTMTFLRQIGGSIGLAIAGTLFNSTFLTNIPTQIAAHGVSPDVIAYEQAHIAAASNSFTGVGNLVDIIRNGTAAQIAAGGAAPDGSHVPLTTLQQVHDQAPQIVAGIHDAFSLSAGTVFWLVVVAGGLAFFASLLVREVPLRGRGSAPDGSGAGPDSEAAAVAADDEPLVVAGH